MRYYCLCLLFFYSVGKGLTQQTGVINYEQLGISFTIPEGWVGQEVDEMFLIASKTKPGVILLSAQEYTTLSEMQYEMERGYHDGYGTSLNPTSSIMSKGKNVLHGEYSGTLEGQSAKAYVTGTLNPHGYDVFIMAATTTSMYTDEYKELALNLENSLRFKQPEEAPASNDWQSMLSGVRLTYMHTYNSTSYSTGGVSGGFSSEIKIDLCEAGYFNYYGNDDMALGNDYSSAYSSSKGQGNGQWEVKGNILRLQFNNGQVAEYQLTWEEEKLYLDGYRYFRTWSGEYAPDCNE